MNGYDKTTKLTVGTYTDILLCEDGVTILKVVRDEKDTPRLKKEAEIVRKLRGTALADLFPELLDDSVALKVCDSCPNRFKCFTSSKDFNCSMKNNALAYRYDKDMPSLSDVLNKYPSGIDERDMVWMFKRLLAATWVTHSMGVVHSAILPEHVLLDLKTHGIWLIDWMHINKINTTPKISILGSKDFYPTYKIEAENSTAIDIHMVAMCMIKIMGGLDKASKDIRLILRACTMGATNALEVHEQLDKTVKKLYGSVFRPFKV